MPESFLVDDYGDKFWSQFPTVELPSRPEPWICHKTLREVAISTKFPDMKEINRVCDMLEKGADTGVRGAARLPQTARNSPKVQIYGPRVMEVIRDWLSSRLMCGPFKAAPPWAKLSPVGVVLKPTAKARLLQDLSFPHLRKPDLKGDTPVSFNAGIDKSQYKTMSATAADVLLRLYQVGNQALVAKIDWAGESPSHGRNS